MDIYVYIYYLLHREQLHVSALGNGHLQVVYETLSKQLYKTYIWASYMGGTAVAQWLRCCATIRKVAGSIPADVGGFPIALWPWGRLSL